MTKKKGTVEGETKSREVVKAEIKKLFGVRMLGKAMLRLCKVCERRGDCLLYPLTTRGEDCQYFKEVKNATNNSNTG